MNLIVFHTASKNRISLEIAKGIEGDTLQIESVKKPLKRFFFQLFVYGYQTVANKQVEIKPLNIDYDKYSDIYLISPVWAGRVNAYMRQFLQNHPFSGKKVHIIGSCDGGYEKYFDTFNDLLDETNEIIEKTIYVKGQKKD